MVDNYNVAYVTKNFKKIKETSEDDMEGILLYQNSLDNQDHYLKFLKKVNDFEKEYEIDWNRLTILKGEGDVYSTVENISSLKSLTKCPDVIFLTAEQLKKLNEHMKEITFKENIKTLSAYLNYCVEQFGWLYFVDIDNIKLISPPVSRISKVRKSSKQKKPLNSNPKTKKIHTIKRSKTVSNAKKTKNRKKHKFLRSIGR